MLIADVSGLDIVTLCVAIGGVSLAALSLGWQAATFVLSGSRVRLTLLRGALRHEGGGAVTRATMPLDSGAHDIAVIREQDFMQEVVVVEVRNRGRLAVSVESVNARNQRRLGVQPTR